MAATYNKFDSFVEALAEEKHNFSSDTFVLALTDTGYAPAAANTCLANLTQIAYTNLSDRTLVCSGHGQTGGLLTVVFTDKVLTASGTVASFRYVTVYNDTAPAKELVCWFDYGSPVTLQTSETFTVDFGASLFTLQ